MLARSVVEICCFFFNDTATTEIYTLSLHDALPIWRRCGTGCRRSAGRGPCAPASAPSWEPRCSPAAGSACAGPGDPATRDRKSTRLNSSHANISYAVFCLKKKNIPAILYEKTSELQ